MGWADVGENGGYSGSGFADAARALTRQQLRIIRQADFDFVRLAVDPGPFLELGKQQHKYLNAHLTRTLRAIRAEELSVVVDIHPSDMHNKYRPSAFIDNSSRHIFRDYLQLIRYITEILEESRYSDAPRYPSNNLRRRSTIVALELMNEPEIGARSWQPHLDAAYKASREVSKQLVLVLGGGNQNSLESLLEMDTTEFRNDDASIFTFHDYEPWQFTHQGVVGNPAVHLTHVPYPSSPVGTEQAVTASRRALSKSVDGETGSRTALDAVTRDLKAYAAHGYDRDRRNRRYDAVAAWAAKRDVERGRILLGEFGVHRTPYQFTDEGLAARLRWFNETRETAESRGFGWSAWVYKAPGGFGLTASETSEELDPATLTALGMTGGNGARGGFPR